MCVKLASAVKPKNNKHSDHCSEVSSRRFGLVGDSWWSLLIGGCCLEVVVNSGLTVLNFRIME